MEDIQLKLDKLIEEKVYNRFEPTVDPDAFFGMGWWKERDGRYYNQDYHPDTRSYRVRDTWPRRFSDCMQLAWKLAEKFMIQMIPVKYIYGKTAGWVAKCGKIEVEDESATMAICLLVVLLVKNKE